MSTRAGRRRAPLRAYADRLAARVGALQARRPLAFLAAGLALAALFGAMATRLTLRTQFEELLPEGEPSVAELRRLRARLAEGSIVSVVLEGEDPAALRRASAGVARAVAVARPPWLVDASDGVRRARAFLLPRAGLFADAAALAALRDDIEAARGAAVMRAAGLDLDLDAGPSFPTARQIERRLLPREPAVADVAARWPDGEFRTPDGRARVVLVRTSIPPGDLDAARAAYAAVREATDRVLATPAGRMVRASYAGDLVTGLFEYGAVRRDLAQVGALGVGLVLAVVSLFFMRLRAIAVLGVTIAAGLSLTFGTTWLLLGHLNVATGFLVSIVAGNGINSGIIYAARYFEERRAGAGPEAAIVTATRATWLPTFGAALAAGSAYASLAITRFLGLREFAVVGGAGMLLCWAATFALTPPLLALFDRYRPLGTGRGAAVRDLARRAGMAFGTPFAAAVTRAPALVLVASVVVTSGGGWLAVRYLRGDRMEYDARKVQNDLGDAPEVRRAAALAGRILGANLESGVVVLADRLDQVLPLKRALEAKRDQAPAAARPFEAVRTLLDFVAPEQAAKIPILEGIARTLRRARARGRIPDEEWRILSPYLPPPGLRPYGVADLPEEIARPFEERDGTRGRVLVIEPTAGQDDSDVHYLVRFTDAFRDTALPSGERIRGSGRAVIFADILTSILADMPAALGLSLAMTALAAVVTLRRAALAAVVLAALLAGVTWLLAAMELLQVRINFINFVALPVTFGIGVDYALNVVQRWTSGEGVEVAVARTGSAVVLCSLTTILSYLALLRSINQAVRSLGLVAVLGEACCLAAAMLTLPAALVAWERRRQAARDAAGIRSSG